MYEWHLKSRVLFHVHIFCQRFFFFGRVREEKKTLYIIEDYLSLNFINGIDKIYQICHTINIYNNMHIMFPIVLSVTQKSITHGSNSIFIPNTNFHYKWKLLDPYVAYLFVEPIVHFPEKVSILSQIVPWAEACYSKRFLRFPLIPISSLRDVKINIWCRFINIIFTLLKGGPIYSRHCCLYIYT